MTGKVLTRQLNGKTESGWDLNTRPLNTAKVTLHYASLCFHQVHQVLCRYCRASRHRYRKKYWNIHWQILRPDEIWTDTRWITQFYHIVLRNDGFDKFHKFRFVTAVHRSASREKVFSYAYTEKFGTSWDLNPHCSGRSKSSPHYAYESFCQVPEVWWRHS